MSKTPKKTLKEYAEDAAARLKRSKSGSLQQKDEKKKSVENQKNEKTTRKK